MAKVLKSKRNLWREVEVETLLSIIKEKHILNLLGGKQKRNQVIYENIKEEMKLKGFEKSADQIRTKFKGLKSEYYKVMRNNNTSEAERRTCPYYEILNEILYDCPLVNTEGICTSVIDPLSEIVSDTNENDVLLTEESQQNIQEDQMNNANIQNQDQKDQPNKLKVFNNPKKKTYEKVVQAFTKDWTRSQSEMLKTLKQQDEIFIEEMKRQQHFEEELLRKHREETEKILERDRAETSQLLSSLLHTIQRSVEFQSNVPHFSNSQNMMNNPMTTPTSSSSSSSSSLFSFDSATPPLITPLVQIRETTTVTDNEHQNQPGGQSKDEIK